MHWLEQVDFTEEITFTNHADCGELSSLLLHWVAEASVAAGRLHRRNHFAYCQINCKESINKSYRNNMEQTIILRDFGLPRDLVEPAQKKGAKRPQIVILLGPLAEAVLDKFVPKSNFGSLFSHRCLAWFFRSLLEGHRGEFLKMLTSFWSPFWIHFAYVLQMLQKCTHAFPLTRNKCFWRCEVFIFVRFRNVVYVFVESAVRMRVWFDFNRLWAWTGDPLGGIYQTTCRFRRKSQC